MKLIHLLAVALLVCLASASKHYNGDEVWRVRPDTEHEVDQLWKLLNKGKYDFWKEPSSPKRPVDIQVEPSRKEFLQQFLDDRGMRHKIMIQDVQQLIESEEVPEGERDPESLDLDTGRYHDLDEIHEWLDDIAETCGEDCQTFSIGQSTEGRELMTIEITKPGEDRQAVWLDCTIHAREWISPATCVYMIGRLILDDDEVTTELREKYDWYILPVQNVDGYAYTWEEERLWRKTRSGPHGDTECIGVDPNRNYDYMWALRGGSTDPCSQTYYGPSAASEPEIAAVQDFLYGERGRFVYMMTIHSYGQFIMTTWAYNSSNPPEDIDEQVRVAAVGSEAMTSAHGETFTYQAGGSTAGMTLDWAKAVGLIKYSYLVELRDKGEHGFLLPPEQIEPCVEETWAGIQAMVQTLDP